MFADPHAAALHLNAELRRQLETRRLESENERLARELAGSCSFGKAKGPPPAQRPNGGRKVAT